MKKENTLEENFTEIIKNIKQEIQQTQLKTMQQVNSNLINLYFKIGKMIFKNKQYGNSFTKRISTDIKISFPELKGFSERNLRAMRAFYEEYANDRKWQQLVAKLPWGHNLLLMEKIKDKEIRKIYAENTIKYGWSRSVLAIQIETNFHKRIGSSSTNFKISLPEYESDLANNTLKDPYIFDFITLRKNYKEKELEKALTEKIKNVLLELGKGFSFVGNQYKISTENTDYYIDLLFYHLDLNSYIVVELKTTEFKPEYIGQLSFYIKAIDKTLKKEDNNPTIGLLLCKNKDKLSVEWSLETTNVPIGVSSYQINESIPQDILNKLPSEEDINRYLNL